MSLLVLQFTLSAVFISTAGYWLTKAADKIAELTGLGKMFVGSLLLAGATSLPELMVDLKSIELGLPNLAVGDLLGSSLFNLLILAILDFSFPSAFKRTAFSPVFLHHSLAAVLTMILSAIIGIAIVARLEFEVIGIGIFSWILIIVYFFGIRIIYVDGNHELAAQKSKKNEQARMQKKNILLAIVQYFFSTIIIFLTAPFLVEAADSMARLSGIGHTFIGTTLVALSTSLPELVSTLVAFRIGAPDLALGNIFGSNAFNSILFIPLDFMFAQSLFSSVSFNHAITAFGIVVATGVAVMGQLYRKKERSRFLEPSSEIVVIVIALVLFLVFFTS